ncbi:hypothetical protein P3T76_006082 [Phytophthora citrophthora]|uniref:Uncharacterized protein n=1 Tax=Phytophthora citrophthora TaxID=4793 RepID=A0AAD9GQV9_9STRA|nr:hypothetical protein P3T76_006082 [Phytophthora citrophthora]
MSLPLFDFSDFQAAGLALPAIRFDMNDIPTFTVEVMNRDSALFNCLERLTVPWYRPINPNWQTTPEYLDSLLRILASNGRLEYLRIQLTTPSRDLCEAVQELSSTTNQSLDQTRSTEQPQNEKRKSGSKQRRMTWENVDANVVSTIFQFAASPIMRKRWGFLKLWTRVLQHLPQNLLCQTQPGPFDPPQFYVSLDLSDCIETQMIQEGLKLLAAVSKVDYDAWKYLLLYCCGVDLDERNAEWVDCEVVVRFKLLLGFYDHPVSDLAQMCGVQQYDHPRREYLGASQDCSYVQQPRSKEVWFGNSSSNRKEYFQWTLYELLKIQDAKEMIQREWDEETLPPLEAESFRFCKNMDSKFAWEKWKSSKNWSSTICGDLHWWKWLAYGFLSKQARTNSSLEALTLKHIARMTTPAIDAFCAVLSSELPEELLFGCTSGADGVQDATLAANSPIRCNFNDQNEPVVTSDVLKVATPILFLRILSGNAESEWVIALIPGYGRCQVQRKNLVFSQPVGIRPGNNLKTLEMCFLSLGDNDFSGLPYFFAAIGTSLKTLIINTGSLDVDVPKVGAVVLTNQRNDAVTLNFSAYHAASSPLPAITVNFNDTPAFTRELMDNKISITMRWSANPEFRQELDAILEDVSSEANQSIKARPTEQDCIPECTVENRAAPNGQKEDKKDKKIVV